jgi:hypothetical protein
MNLPPLKSTNVNPFAAPVRPQTKQQWKEAGRVAEIVLELELARKWGLIDQSGKLNVGLAESLLGRAQELGLAPRR